MSKKEVNNVWADTATIPAGAGLYEALIVEPPTRYTSKKGEVCAMVRMELVEYGSDDGIIYTHTDYVRGISNILHVKDNLSKFFGKKFKDAGEVFAYAMENRFLVNITENGPWLNCRYYHTRPEELEEPETRVF